MTSLAAIAARTQKLKFGPSVLVLPYRTPVVAAKEIATIDWLSRGRLFPRWAWALSCLANSTHPACPSRSVAGAPTKRSASCVLLWTEDEVSYQGEFFKLDRVTVFPKPWQTPPPIWIGGKSEAAQKRTARLGDGWIPSFITPEEFRVGVHKVQELAAAEKREVPEDHFGTLINYTVAASEAEAFAMAQPYVPRGRVDEATMRACTAFGPSRCSRRGSRNTPRAAARRFILRPLCPPQRMLEQLALAAEQGDTGVSPQVDAAVAEPLSRPR
jgi:alkanesulfonate monooxygenase SsuD/methylene tetrahydromethanopterin reductase-like flavin-dependent oxidoreductase (luciferase family)